MKLKHLGGKLYAVKGKSISFLRNHTMVTSNSIFVDDEEKAIIDPSSNPGVLSQIAANNKIDYCFFSHSHFDHVCSYHLFPDSRHLMHEVEPVPRPKSPWFFNVNNSDCFFPNRRILKNLGLPNFQPQERFGDGQLFKIGNTELLAIHTPGHTRGHTCFYFPKERVLYSADFDLSVFGPWYGQQDSSIEDFISSTEKLKRLPTDIWLTGHWKWIIRDNIQLRLAQYIRQIEERDQRILRSLEKASSLRRLYHLGMIRPTQNMEMSNLIKKSEKVMLQKHLERFEALGQVRRGRLNRWKKVGNGTHAVQVEKQSAEAP